MQIFIQGVQITSLPGFLSGDSDLDSGFHRIALGWSGPGTTLADGSTIK